MLIPEAFQSVCWTQTRPRRTSETNMENTNIDLKFEDSTFTCPFMLSLCPNFETPESLNFCAIVFGSQQYRRYEIDHDLKPMSNP